MICKRCGVLLTSNSKKCWNCGLKIVTETNKNGRKISLVILVTIIVLELFLPFYVFVITFLPLYMIIIKNIRPLTYEEVEELAEGRRNRDIGELFKYKKPKDKLKKQNFIEYSVENIPYALSEYFKNKNKSWLAVVFERNDEIVSLWIDEGLNNGSIIPYISNGYICEKSKKVNADKVMFFHNNANSECMNLVNNYTMEVTRNLGEELKRYGVSLCAFVCYEDKPFKYFFSARNDLNPMFIYEDSINEVNGRSLLDNFYLNLCKVYYRFLKIMQEGFEEL